MEASDQLFFATPGEISNFMPCELSWSTPEEHPPYNMWVFWSRHSNELQSLLGGSYVDTDTIRVSVYGNRTITEKIKGLLPRMRFIGELIQFWVPVRTGERTYLTTTDQPFGLNKFHKGLCSYRRHCVSSILTPVDDVNEQGGGGGGGDEEHNNLGPLVRVFRRCLPEFCGDVSHYLIEEFPMRDYALKHGIKCYGVLPLFDTVGKQFIGILEILSTVECHARRLFSIVDCELMRMDMTRDASGADPFWSPPGYNDYGGYHAAFSIMRDLCRGRQFLFAKFWVGKSSGRCITEEYICRTDGHGTEVEVNNSFHPRTRMFEGEGVAGKAFSLRSACFCKNVSHLRQSVYPLAADARKCRLAGCFAICLQSNRLRDEFYILEFFLSRDEIDYGDPRNFLCTLVTALKAKVNSSLLQQLRENVFVEVIKVSSDDELESFEVCGPWAFFRVPQGREVTQHDSEPIDTRDNINAEKNNNVVNKDKIITTRQPSEAAISGFGALAKSSNIDFFSASLFPSSSSETLYHGGGINVVQNHGNETTQENVSKEQHGGAKSLPTISSLPQQSVAVESINEENVIRIEHDDVNGSSKHGKVRTLDAEYEISREVLEQHSRMKLKDVAATLGVSRSTLKRICRKNDIFRWPPCNGKRSRSSVNPQDFIQATERHTSDDYIQNQQLDDPPQQEHPVSRLHTVPDPSGEQDNSCIIVKAAYGDDIIKFQLSVSSRKLDLEDEVAIRLNLSRGSFKIKYLDEDEDWILVTCDADLRDCLSALRLSGKTTIKMLVISNPEGTIH